MGYVYMEELLSRAGIFAILAVAVSLVRYGLYLTSIFRGETRPHLFSWTNWGLIVGIGSYAQYALGGGFSTYVLAFVSATCFFIAFLALFYGEKKITRSDWLAFLSALALIPVWMATQEPLLTLFLIIIIDLLTFYPTLRKTYVDPSSEPPNSYFWAGLRYFFTLFTVPSFGVVVLFYPVFLMLTEWGFMGFIIWRRKALRLEKEATEKADKEAAPVSELMP
jgi:hypothetical protein